MSGSRLAGPAPADVPASTAEVVAPTADATHVPQPATGVVRLGPMAGSGYREPPRLVRRGDGQIIQLSPLLDAVLEAVDGQLDLALVTDAASEYHGRRLHVDDVHYLIEHKLRPLGLVRAADGSEPDVAKVNPLLGLRARVTVTRPDRTWALTRPFVWLFRPAVVATVSVAFAVFAAWVLFDRGIESAVNEAMQDPGMVLALIGLIVASAAFHEIGHAAACRYGGARPGVMGAALYLIWPAFFTDVTDSYRLDRVGRLRVDLGGLYFNALFALVAGGLWALTSAEALLVLVPVQLAQMVRQLIPLVRFDGYHILADLVGVPDLFARIRPTLRRALPWHWRDPEPNPLRPWAQAVVVSWVALVVPALALMFGYLALHLPEMLASSSATVRAQADLVGQHLDRRNLDAVALGAVSIGLVALVPLSTVYLLSRLAHRTSRGVWRATDGHPLVRASVVGVVLVALVLSAPGMLPSERPDTSMAAAGADQEVAAGDRLDDDAVPTDAVMVQPAVQPLPRARRQEQHATAAPDAGETRVPAAPAPAAPVVKESVARTPTPPARPPATAPEPAWPFSFPAPAAPGPGDNQVMVVNTTDGGARFDLSATLEWDSDDTVDQANRAYALASCTECRTVAAAFQIVLATVPNHVAVPENLAVAVNEDCETCVTEAVAVQLVVTLDGEPDRSVRNRLRALVRSVDARRGWFAQRSPAEILAEFRRAEAEALALLEPWMPSEDPDEVPDADADELESASDVERDERPGTDPGDASDLDGTGEDVADPDGTAVELDASRVGDEPADVAEAADVVGGDGSSEEDPDAAAPAVADDAGASADGESDAGAASDASGDGTDTTAPVAVEAPGVEAGRDEADSTSDGDGLPEGDGST